MHLPQPQFLAIEDMFSVIEDLLKYPHQLLVTLRHQHNTSDDEINYYYSTSVEEVTEQHTRQSVDKPFTANTSHIPSTSRQSPLGSDQFERLLIGDQQGQATSVTNSTNTDSIPKNAGNEGFSTVQPGGQRQADESEKTKDTFSTIKYVFTYPFQLIVNMRQEHISSEISYYYSTSLEEVTEQRVRQFVNQPFTGATREMPTAERQLPFNSGLHEEWVRSTQQEQATSVCTSANDKGKVLLAV